jgi:hypothetical protein
VNDLNIWARLFIAQAFGDVVFQTRMMGLYKSWNPLILFIHSIVVAGCFWICMGFRHSTLWVFYLTLVTHFIIDFFTSNMKPANTITWVTYFDIFLHGTVMVYIWLKIRG